MKRIPSNFWTPVHAALVMLAGSLQREHEAAIAYPKEEFRALRERLGTKRLRFTDAQRRKRAVKARELPNAKLRKIGSLVAPGGPTQPAVGGLHRRATGPIRETYAESPSLSSPIPIELTRCDSDPRLSERWARAERSIARTPRSEFVARGFRRRAATSAARTVRARAGLERSLSPGAVCALNGARV